MSEYTVKPTYTLVLVRLFLREVGKNGRSGP